MMKMEKFAARTLISLLMVSAVTLVAAPGRALPISEISGAILFSSFSWSKDGTTLSVVGPSIVAKTGDLSGETSVVINDLDYSPFSPLDPLWETDNFKFAITSLTIIIENATQLELEGSGTMTDKNAILSPTIGTWSFSGGSINWSSAVVVPEPTTATLMGLGIVGLGFWRRSKSAS